jgi:threonine aldolase
MSTVTSSGTAQHTDRRVRVTTVDLRSDTVTRPTPEMRRAMAEAEVGDDVYGEDPTINRLEQRAAQIFGRESAIFVPTGSMGNAIAIKVHTRPGQEVICDERGHICNYEMATMAQFAGCLARTIHGEDGILRWAQVERKISPKTYYYAQTGLVSLENTHNMAGGTVYPQQVTAPTLPDCRCTWTGRASSMRRRRSAGRWRR